MSGCVVKTSDGKTGRTYTSKGLINGKVAVYVTGEDKPRLCSPEKLVIKGYID